MKRPWEVNRRAILRGTGIAIGLPWLEAMIPGEKRARAAGSPAPKRLFFYLAQGGTPDTTNTGSGGGRPGSLRPRSTGPGYETTPVLKPFADMNLKQDITVISDLSNFVTVVKPPPHDGSDHTKSMAIFAGVDPMNIERENKAAGISVDQLAANAFKTYTPALPSLYLEPRYDDNGRLLSWKSETLRNTPVEKTSEAFSKVFGDGGDPRVLQKRLAYRKSILDYATGDIGRLQLKLGKADSNRLANYLTSIRDLETKITAAGSSGTNACGANLPASSGGSMPATIKQLLDLTVLAFQCDRTRVVMIGQHFNGETYDWLNPPYPSRIWHDYQHAERDATGAELNQMFDFYEKGCAWSMQQFGYFVDKLKTTSDASGDKLIDSSLAVITSEMSYGNGHWLDAMPVVIAGRAGGVAQGRHLAPGRQPISNLWVAMLNAVGVNVSSLGDSTRPLDLS